MNSRLLAEKLVHNGRRRADRSVTAVKVESEGQALTSVDEQQEVFDFDTDALFYLQIAHSVQDVAAALGLDSAKFSMLSSTLMMELIIKTLQYQRRRAGIELSRPRKEVWVSRKRGWPKY